MAAFTTPLMTAFRPGQSPPPVSMAILLVIAFHLVEFQIGAESKVDTREGYPYRNRGDIVSPLHPPVL
jgi:hypothetical protein